MADAEQKVELKLLNQIEAVKLQTEQQMNLMGQQFIENVNVIRPLCCGPDCIRPNSFLINEGWSKRNSRKIILRSFQLKPN